LWHRPQNASIHYEQIDTIPTNRVSNDHHFVTGSTRLVGTSRYNLVEAIESSCSKISHGNLSLNRKVNPINFRDPREELYQTALNLSAWTCPVIISASSQPISQADRWIQETYRSLNQNPTRPKTTSPTQVDFGKKQEVDEIPGKYDAVSLPGSTIEIFWTTIWQTFRSTHPNRRKKWTHGP